MDSFITRKLSTLCNHLIGCSFCPNDIKKQARDWRGLNEEEEAELAETSTSSQPLTAKCGRSDSTKFTDKRIGKQGKFTVVSAKAHSFPPSKQLEWEAQLLHAFVSAGWAYNSISDPEVQKLFHNYVPGAVVPTRQKLSKQILDREVISIQGSHKAATQGAYATIQCDGWKDTVSKKHLVAFMYTTNRQVQYLT